MARTTPAMRCTARPNLFLGATANPGAPKFEAEVENTRRKIDAGARMLQTQAIYHVDQLKRFIDAVKPDGVAMLAGIIPLKSEKSGPWLNANLPGVVVPADMLEAMEQAAKEGRARERGIELAGGVIRDLQGHRAGRAHHGHRRRGRSARHPLRLRRASRLLGAFGAQLFEAPRVEAAHRLAVDEQVRHAAAAAIPEFLAADPCWSRHSSRDIRCRVRPCTPWPACSSRSGWSCRFRCRPSARPGTPAASRVQRSAASRKRVPARSRQT